VAFRKANRKAEPSWFNNPVPSFGESSARLAVVGLAPGLKGANRTGRPFTGDFAGELLYRTLKAHGFARGTYEARADDGFTLVDCLVTNAVRCVPPENKPLGAEIATCRQFLKGRLDAMPKLKAVLALGRVAHESVTAAVNGKGRLPFSHGAMHELRGGIALFDSYHCSRYNTNTGVLTPAMFDQVVANIRAYLDRQ
jgi:uracil-DNA glycosylase family 4